MTHAPPDCVRCRLAMLVKTEYYLGDASGERGKKQQRFNTEEIAL
jgi:hypothetical protein